MRTFEEVRKDIREVNSQILELKTQLYILQGKKEELIREHNELVAELSRFNQLGYTTQKVEEAIQAINQGLEELPKLMIQ